MKMRSVFTALILMPFSAFAGQGSIIVGNNEAMMTLSRSSAVITIDNSKMEEIAEELNDDGIISISGVGDIKVENISRTSPFVQGTLNGSLPVVLIPHPPKRP